MEIVDVSSNFESSCGVKPKTLEIYEEFPFNFFCVSCRVSLFFLFFFFHVLFLVVVVFSVFFLLFLFCSSFCFLFSDRSKKAEKFS